MRHLVGRPVALGLGVAVLAVIGARFGSSARVEDRSA